MVCCSVVWCGVVWCGVVWCGVVCCVVLSVWCVVLCCRCGVVLRGDDSCQVLISVLAVTLPL